MFILGCQQSPLSSNKDESNKNTVTDKKRRYVRINNLSEKDTPVSLHEQRAKAYPSFYIIEGNNNDKKVALTFDDGPDQHTQKVVEKLNKFNVKATFFMIGQKISSQSSLVKSMHQQGHLLANHSWDHTKASQYQDADSYWSEQIAPTNQIIQETTGLIPTLFRPPYGNISDPQILKLIDNKIKTVIWSIDTQDWNDNINTKENVASHAIKHAHPEAIILMHDGGGNRQGTVDALSDIIEHYRQLNYQFVTVDELF